MSTTRALYLFALEYHGGQWSRLYRLQCRLSRRLTMHNILRPATIHDLDGREYETYVRAARLARVRGEV